MTTIDIAAIRSRANFSADPHHAQDVNDLIAELKQQRDRYECAHADRLARALERDRTIDEREYLKAELEKVRAQLTAANHHTDNLAADVRDMQKANTAYANENARLRSKLADTEPIVDSAKAWRWSGETADGYRRAEAALMAAVDALKSAGVA